MNTIFKTLLIVILIMFGLFLVIQVLPIGKPTSNPPVGMEPDWNSPETRQLAVRACFDCHSNETKWPWYSRIAPMSWLIANDVQEGRSVLNFSEWNKPQGEGHEIGEVIYEGEMPPPYYIVLHRTAKLSQSEKQALVNGLNTISGLEGEEGDD